MENGASNQKDCILEYMTTTANAPLKEKKLNKSTQRRKRHPYLAMRPGMYIVREIKLSQIQTAYTSP